MRLIRTASSPSLISISAMPDSSSSSISFLIFRMSMPGMPLKRFEETSSGCCELARSRTQRQLVAVGTETGDDADGDVREIGMFPKRLARVHVRQVYLNERQ